MRTIITLFLIFTCSVCYAEVNEKYSYKAFPYHRLSFKDRPASEFNNTTIVGSCFYQEWVEGDADVEKDIFPNGMTGVTFKKCNLNNIKIPSGNTVIGSGSDKSTVKRIKVQNDWKDWVVEKDIFGSWKPVEPNHKEWRIKANKSIDPEDIPNKKFTKEEYKAFQEELHEEAVISP